MTRFDVHLLNAQWEKETILTLKLFSAFSDETYALQSNENSHCYYVETYSKQPFK